LRVEPSADYSIFVQQHAPTRGDEDRADRAALVVVDERGDVFARLRSMPFATGIWRTVQAPAGLELPESTLVLFVAYEQPDWDAIRECAHRYPTVVLSANARTEHHLIALRAGAFGYVDLAMAPDGLQRTLIGALRGEPAYPRESLGTWMREGRVAGRRGVRGSRVDRLTSRQAEIVNLIASGATDKEIGAELGIRTATAQKHVANLLRRLGVANRAAAVGLLFKEGEVLPPGRRPDVRRR
jgi:DNA-binding NarL/FixJ family response regulator